MHSFAKLFCNKERIFLRGNLFIFSFQQARIFERKILIFLISMKKTSRLSFENFTWKLIVFKIKELWNLTTISTKTVFCSSQKGYFSNKSAKSTLFKNWGNSTWYLHRFSAHHEIVLLFRKFICSTSDGLICSCNLSFSIGFRCTNNEKTSRLFEEIFCWICLVSSLNPAPLSRFPKTILQTSRCGDFESRNLGILLEIIKNFRTFQENFEKCRKKSKS